MRELSGDAYSRYVEASLKQADWMGMKEGLRSARQWKGLDDEAVFAQAALTRQVSFSFSFSLSLSVCLSLSLSVCLSVSLSLFLSLSFSLSLFFSLCVYLYININVDTI
jgi:hypothetical protein